MMYPTILLVSIFQLPLVKLDRILEAKVEGIANQCMAYRYFHQAGNRFFEILQIVEIEIMACIQSNI